MKINTKSCKILIFFGGPSNERNISLDSARTFYDSIRHYLAAENLTLIFVSKEKIFFYLNPSWIYSNTIEDFEDLLKRKKQDQIIKRSYKKKINTPIKKNNNLEIAGNQLSSNALNNLINQADAFFPLIHGTFGEDGKLTSLIQKQNRKAILGSLPKFLFESFKKNLSHSLLKKLGFKTYPYFLINRKDWLKSSVSVISEIKKFFSYQRLLNIVVKPNDCGSSDGVSMVYEVSKITEAVDHAFLFSNEILVEEKILGKEFSIILIEDYNNKPLSLFPTEIVLKKKQNTFYSRQKKYMPGSGVEHITPANFSKNLIQKIRHESEYIFKHFGFSDWARFDGFLLKDGTVIWSDLNSIPGIGQDGLLFQQSIYLGIDTYNLCKFILNKVLKKEGKAIQNIPKSHPRREVIGVLGGGSSSERQVSRMSWCNVIEKLDRLHTYDLKYFFMDKKNKVWLVPRPYTLKHTTEEIEYLIRHSNSDEYFPLYETVYRRVQKIFPEVKRQNFKPIHTPVPNLKKHIHYLFNCLHGGVGENGSLQKKLEQIQLTYNGSSSVISKLAFNKNKNHELVSNYNKDKDNGRQILLPAQLSINLKEIKRELLEDNWNNKRINSLAKKIVSTEGNFNKIKQATSTPDYKNYLNKMLLAVRRQVKKYLKKSIHRHVNNKYLKKWENQKFIVKPASDGCSTGVIVCDDFDFQIPLYFLFCFSYCRFLPSSFFYSSTLKNTFLSKKNKEKFIRLPNSTQNQIIFEEFMDIKKGFIELTVGVVGKKGKMISLLPSKTIAESQILSLDEKFNKGVGPNLTPPRELSYRQIESIRNIVATFANRIGLADYARIDLFYHLKKEQLYLIEVNTLPGLTAATILFTQALITPEFQSLPSEFLDKIISFKKEEKSILLRKNSFLKNSTHRRRF